ncbi:MAG: hypothetical protein FWE38_03640 [Firmicutes bacterium]|nr:hypothetical protein [Bacillota bacterium]
MTTSTQTRFTGAITTDDAHTLLYGNVEAVPSRWAGFETAHDTTNYDKLVETKYATTIADVTAAQPSYSSMEAKLDSIFGPAASLQQQQSTSTPVINAAPKSVFEQYVTPSNPPSNYTGHAFRPKIFDKNLAEINTAEPVQIIETVFAEPVVETRAEIKQIKRVENDPEEEVSYSLNARGVIAVAAFLAVLALVTILIVINAINLGSNTARITSLQAQNTILSNQVNQAMGERNERRDELSNEIRNELDANGTIRGEEFIPVPPPTELPPQHVWQPAPNPDYSSNWFDRLSQWLGGIFGR